MKKKLLGVLVGSLVLTGCNGFGASGKTLTCTTSYEADGGKQEVKYVMKFNDEGTILEKVDATIRWSDTDVITTDMVEEAFCNDDNDMVKDTCEVKKLKNNGVEVSMSKKISDSDDVILGDFYIDDNSTYEKTKENFEENNWNSVDWTCK